MSEQGGPLSPVDALRVIRRIACDQKMGPAQRLAAIIVVLNADNDTGLSWTSYDGLRERAGLSNDAISGALAWSSRKGHRGTAIGRHVVPVRRGQHGSVQYRILTVGEAGEPDPQDDRQRSDHRSATPPALRPPERCTADSALRSSPASAPISGVQRSDYRSDSYSTDSPHCELAPENPQTPLGVERSPQAHSGGGPKRTVGDIRREEFLNGGWWTWAVEAMTGDSLQTEAFRDAWKRFCQYRETLAWYQGERKASILLRVRALERLGHDEAIRRIDCTIAHRLSRLPTQKLMDKLSKETSDAR